MLTDDDLTNQLGAAFRAGTEDLTYSGRRRPRRTAVVAVPAVTVGLALTTVGVVAALNAGSPAKAPVPSVAVPAPQHSATAPGPLVTDKIHVAGYTFTYAHATGQQDPVIATVKTSVPDGFTPISATNGAKAWVGKDPGDGDNAVYVQVSDSGGVHLFSLHSPVWTQDQLVTFFHDGTPHSVPLVKE